MQEGFSLSKSSYSRWPEISCEESKGCGGLFLELVSQSPQEQRPTKVPAALLLLQPFLLDQPQIYTSTECLRKGLSKLGS